MNSSLIQHVSSEINTTFVWVNRSLCCSMTYFDCFSRLMLLHKIDRMFDMLRLCIFTFLLTFSVDRNAATWIQKIVLQPKQQYLLASIQYVKPQHTDWNTYNGFNTQEASFRDCHLLPWHKHKEHMFHRLMVFDSVHICVHEHIRCFTSLIFCLAI